MGPTGKKMKKGLSGAVLLTTAAGILSGAVPSYAQNATVPVLQNPMMLQTEPRESVVDPADNPRVYPNIFRAFEENVSGIDHSTLSDNLGSYNGAGQRIAADVSRLPVVAKAPTLWGEFDYISWPIFVTAADMSNTVRVSITFQNAASVMPENSQISLYVNGTKVAASTLQSPATPGTLAADLPAAVLTAGYNALTVIVHQHHRVDCSAEATYELWTRIDTARSFIEYGGNKQRVSAMRDIAGMPLDQNQALPIRLHFPDNQPFEAAGERSQRYLRTVQEAAIVRGTHKTDVQVANPDNTGLHQPGLDLFAGTVAELQATSTLARLYDFSTIEARVAGASTNALFMTSRDSRRTLMFKANEIATRDDAFAKFSEKPIVGSPAGEQLAKAELSRALENTSVSMRELGFIENEFIGRRFNGKFGFELPSDFFPGSYDEISLHLFGMHMDGLKQGQRLLIRINGQSEVSLPLTHRRAGVFEDKIVQLELARFKPGYNEIEMEAFVEKPSDDSCFPGQQIEPEPRFFISGDSFLTIPKLAKMGRFPNVGTTLNTGFPYRTEDGRGGLDVVLSDSRSETLGKAADFVAAMAGQSNQLFNARLQMPSGVSADGFALNRVLVGRFDSLPPTYAQRLQGTDMTQMVAYWSNPAIDVASANVDTMRTSALGDADGGLINLDLGLPSGSQIDLLGVTQTGESGTSMRDQFRRQAQVRRDSSGFGLLFDKLTNFVMAPVRALQPAEKEKRTIPPTASAVVGQVVEGKTLTTVVGYAETGNASAPIGGFFTKRGFSDDLVQTAGLHLTDTAIVSVVGDVAELSMLQDYSIRNVRLIVAGWLSNNPAIYGLLTVLAFLLAGGMSWMALQRTERTVGETFQINE